MPSPPDSAVLDSLIRGLASSVSAKRELAAAEIFRRGRELALAAASDWLTDPNLARLFARDDSGQLEITVGIAVPPADFDSIRAAHGSPLLAEVPPDQDAREFELHFPRSTSAELSVRLDILTTRDPGAGGAIARYLVKFSMGIQQIEFRVHSVEAATQLLYSRFAVTPVYPRARAGANSTRVNFFLVAAPGGGKVLIELFESPSI